MSRIHIAASYRQEPVAPGGSKFLGAPHVWRGFDWPVGADGNGGEYGLDFLCQINCAEVAPFDSAGILPKTGMLYFFFDPADAGYTGDAAIIYWNGNPDELLLLKPMDEDGNDTSLPEIAVAFEKVSYEGFAPPGENSHFMLGNPCDMDQLGLGGQLPKGERLLLEVDSFATADGEIIFGDTGTLCFFIKTKDLAARNFGKAWYRVCSY